MRIIRVISILLIISFIAPGLYAQDKFGLRVKLHHRDDSGAAYNFFMGDDAEDFQTTIKGFGSGFIFDAFTSRNSFDILQLGTKTANLSLGAGFSINKYRFKDNLILSLGDGGVVDYQIDPNPDHDYVNTFFGYGKSKLVTSTFFLPLHLNFTIADQVMLSAGGFVDYIFFGKHKRKFLNDGEKEKVLVKSNEFMDYPLNKIKYGLSASIMHTKTGIGIIGTYYLTPFFEENMGPDLTEARICLVFSANPKLVNRD